MSSQEEFSPMDGLLKISESQVILQRTGLRKLRSYIFNRTGRGFNSNFDEIERVRVYRSFTHIIFEFNMGNEKHKIRFLEKSDSKIINDGEKKISKLVEILEKNTSLKKNLNEDSSSILNYFRDPMDL